MSGFNPFNSGGGGSPTNPDNSYELGGGNTNGTATTITGNASANTKGSYTQLTFAGASGVTVNGFSGFYLFIGNSSASTGRWLIDISFDGGTTVHVPDLYVEPSSSTMHVRIYIPMTLASGRDIRLRGQCSAGSSPTFTADIVGIITNANSDPLWTTCERLTAADTTNTRASTVTAALQDSASTTYPQLVASLGNTYGAFLISPSYNGTNPATSQACRFAIATGAASSETEVAWHQSWVTNASTAFSARALGYFEKSISSGTRLSTKPLVATPGSDAVAVAVHGFR